MTHQRLMQAVQYLLALKPTGLHDRQDALPQAATAARQRQQVLAQGGGRVSLQFLHTRPYRATLTGLSGSSAAPSERNLSGSSLPAPSHFASAESSSFAHS